MGTVCGQTPAYLGIVIIGALEVRLDEDLVVGSLGEGLFELGLDKLARETKVAAAVPAAVASLSVEVGKEAECGHGARKSDPRNRPAMRRW